MPSKGIVYYTDNRARPDILKACQARIAKSGLKIVSASLAPIDFGENIVLPLQRGSLTLFKQMLAAIEKLDTDIVFFCEHDVLYHSSHFDFEPDDDHVFYYNTNVWKVRYPDGHAVWTDDLQQTSGLCACRGLLLSHYAARVQRVEKEGNFDRLIGFEPGTHQYPRGIDNYHAESWLSEYPNLDIRHDKNWTLSKWSPDEFRNQKYAKGWKETGEVPGWGKTEGRLFEIMEDVA